MFNHVSTEVRGQTNLQVLSSGWQQADDKCQSIHQNDLLLKYFRCLIHLSSSWQGLIDAVVSAAEASADSLIQSEGRDVRLEESLDLHLPFLLPEGGYSCDTVRGIPTGFREFLEPICRKGVVWENVNISEI